MNSTFQHMAEALYVRSGSILLQTTVLLAIGLVSARLLRSYGPVFQSHLYKSLSVAVLAIVFFVLVGPAKTAALVTLNARPAERLTFARVISQPKSEAKPAPTKSDLPSPAHATVAETVAQQTPQQTGVEINLASVLVTIWLVGIAVQFFFIAIGFSGLKGLKNRARPITDAAIRESLQQAASKMGVNLPQLLESSEVTGPFLTGIWRPAILLPLREREDPYELEITFLHELAHMGEKDAFWTLCRRLLCAFLWPQPLAWFLARSGWQAAEEAADQHVLDHGHKGTAYAECLLRIAEGQQGSLPAGALGLGVAESVSSVGRRIERLLDTPARLIRILKPKTKIALGTGALAVSALSLTLVSCTDLQTLAAPPAAGSFPPRVVTEWLPPSGYAANFSLAVEKGWSIKPALVVNPGFGPVTYQGKELKFPRFSESDISLIQAINRIEDMNSVVVGWQSAPKKTVSRLTDIISRHPHNFYAEFALARLYLVSGNQPLFQKWYSASLEDAPVILARRIEFEDGRPLANYKMFGQSVQFIDETDQAMVNNYINLVGYSVPTDKNGCFYLPVWDDEMAVGNTSYANTPDISHEVLESSYQQGTFVPQSRVVIIPPIIVRPQVQLDAPFSNAPTNQNAVRITSDKLDFSWKPYPGASFYTVTLMKEQILPSTPTAESPYGLLSYEDESIQDRKIEGGATSVTFKLDGTQPLFDRHNKFMLSVHAAQANGTELSSSQEFWFQPTAALGPLELTEANLAKVLPPKAKILSFRRDSKNNVLTTVRFRIDVHKNAQGETVEEPTVPFPATLIFTGYDEPRTKQTVSGSSAMELDVTFAFQHQAQ